MADTKTVAPAAAPADVGNTLTPGTEVHPSGAINEPEIFGEIDTSHPAIDNNPRQGLPRESYRIDMNDPTLDGQTAVRKNLEAQGSSAGGKPDADTQEPKS